MRPLYVVYGAAGRCTDPELAVRAAQGLLKLCLLRRRSDHLLSRQINYCDVTSCSVRVADVTYTELTGSAINRPYLLKLFRADGRPMYIFEAITRLQLKETPFDSTLVKLTIHTKKQKHAIDGKVSTVPFARADHKLLPTSLLFTYKLLCKLFTSF